MNIIPDKNLFIVTSALNTRMGVISFEDRMEQTIRGLEVLRTIMPEAIIMLADGSPDRVDEEKFRILADYVDFVADFSTDPDINMFAKNHKKSEAENLLLLKCMLLLKNEPTMMKLMQSVNRIFKISGRTELLNTFDVHEHNHWGKYVFKNRIPTWITDPRNNKFTDLLITRLFSLCPSLIDDYIRVTQKNISTNMDSRVDTEHAHFFNIDKDKLVELEQIHCMGTVATSGNLEVY